MFKESFKYYKSKWPIPDFGEVIDFDLSCCKLRELDRSEYGSTVALPPGMQSVENWRCYTLTHPEGLIIIRNAFTTQSQRYWMARCLRDYPKNPNVVNLNSRQCSDAVLEDWWRELQDCRDKNEARRLKTSMRWATLGYHHDWDTKVYSEKMRDVFPSDLSKLCSVFADVLGLVKFKAQAAIVNYYPIGTTLAGHTDHSEVNLKAPLFSFSFGQTAIFLIGGKSKEEKPNALFLQSGDVLVMSREARLCYHAVPRVMKARNELWNDAITQQENLTSPPHAKKLKSISMDASNEWGIDEQLYQQVIDEVFWLPFKNYISDSRININVRQVLEDHETLLPSNNIT